MNRLFDRRRMNVLVVAFAALIMATVTWSAEEESSIVVASTTSTQDSGLFEYLLPIVKKQTGISVRVIAQGTGQALDTGRRGDADVVLVHAKPAELKFLADGDGVKRYPVMYNDFVLIGPRSDPARIAGTSDIAKALQTVAASKSTFISRGDNSGTHMAELALWKVSGVDIDKDRGQWYKSVGQGMGAALNAASAINAYVMSDRATWIHFKNKGEMRIVVQGDNRMFNQYGVMLVNPEKHPSVKREAGQRFIDFLISPGGQQDIANYKIDGEQLFYPNATDPNG